MTKSKSLWLVTAAYVVAIGVGAGWTANWLYGFPGLHHEDWRYPKLKQSAGRWEFVADLAAIHFIPTVQVFIGMIPVYVAVTRPERGITWLMWLAFVIGLAAVAVELVADTQMHRFVRERKPGAAMDRGLWSWSRHPNYFGPLRQCGNGVLRFHRQDQHIVGLQVTGLGWPGDRGNLLCDRARRRDQLQAI